MFTISPFLLAINGLNSDVSIKINVNRIKTKQKSIQSLHFHLKKVFLSRSKQANSSIINDILIWFKGENFIIIIFIEIWFCTIFAQSLITTWAPQNSDSNPTFRELIRKNFWIVNIISLHRKFQVNSLLFLLLLVF